MGSRTCSHRLLIVEDNSDTQRLLRHLLGRSYDVTMAKTFDEAVAAAGGTSFQLLVIDINLGEARTGIDVLQTIRSMPQHTLVPALALTAYALPGDAERYIAAGFDRYLSKPFTSRQLLQICQQLVAVEKCR